MAVCVVVSLLVAALPMLYAIDLGLLVGCIAGLKMGFGESTGPWKVLDRFFNVNRAHREAARTGAGEARRRRRRNHEKAPDLISVAGPAAPREDGHAHTTKRNG